MIEEARDGRCSEVVLCFNDLLRDRWTAKQQQGEKPCDYRGEAAQLQAAENGENSIRRPTNHSVTHAPDNLIKEEPSAGGVGEGLVAESAVSAQSRP